MHFTEVIRVEPEVWNSKTRIVVLKENRALGKLKNYGTDSFQCCNGFSSPFGRHVFSVAAAESWHTSRFSRPIWLLRQLQTSDHKLRAVSALISAGSPEKKMDRNTELRATSGTMNVQQQSSPIGHHKYREIHCQKVMFLEIYWRYLGSVECLDSQ